MTSKIKNIIYPKPIDKCIIYEDNDSDNNGDDKDKKKKEDKYNHEKQNSIITKYINGGISGICGVILSHPIDTIKTHIQTENKLSSFKPSFTNFYKGISAPILGVGLEKAIVFGTYNYIYTKIDNIPVSGAISGIVASFIVTPYERY